MSGGLVECSVCHRPKKPVGRSVGLEAANGYCDDDCSGYRQDPRPGGLWPGEVYDERGFPTVPDDEGGEVSGPTCAYCDNPAACYGEYETCDGSGEGYACDECCGHGNEDGWCRRILNEEYGPS